MAKYANTALTPKSALTTTEERTLTHEGARAWAKDPKTELFTLAVTSMTAENTFYESAGTRDGRLRGLVAQLAIEDPEFIVKLVPWLRNTANMRSAPIVIAAEYALAGGPKKRQVVRSAMARADEPAEFVGYWIGRTGKKTLPGGVQRGVADAVRDLYTEFSALKWDSSRNAVRMGDVINLVHPSPVAEWQGDLFTWLLDKRHHGDVRVGLERLPMIASRQHLIGVPEENRRDLVVGGNWVDHAKAAGVTWEFVSGWIPGGMDAKAWGAVIPQMGYMALLRNLRNFDEAGIPATTIDHVKETLEDPEAVTKSRQFPYRFWSAWNATQSLQWGSSLENALELSVTNIPDLNGTTLVLVDVSGSMNSAVSQKSSVRCRDVAALFGAAMFAKNYGKTRVVVFSSTNKDVTPSQRGSMLRNMETFSMRHGDGYGTELARAVREQYQGEDRVVIFTDMQTHDGGASGLAKYTHYFDLGGYRSVPDRVEGETFMYGGFTDATFRQMALNELTRRSNWDSILSA